MSGLPDGLFWMEAKLSGRYLLTWLLLSVGGMILIGGSLQQAGVSAGPSFLAGMVFVGLAEMARLHLLNLQSGGAQTNEST